MKRMNIANILFLVSFLTISHTYSMRTSPIKKIKPNISNTANTDIFYLAKLPSDICNLIAHYLIFFDRESQEEFITRTKTILTKEIPEKYYAKDFQAPSKNQFEDTDPNFLTFFNIHRKNYILTAFCPHGINVALLDIDTVQIINLPTDQLIHKQKLEDKEYQYIAVSRNATMIATIDKHREHDNTPHYGEVMRYITTNYLTIKNIATQKAETIELPDSFRKKSHLAFNKQGTHLILHGIDYKQVNNLSKSDIEKDPTPHHLIFPVTVNMDTPENGIITEDMIKARNTLASQKTLQHYFHQKGICKSIIGGTNK